MAKNNCDRCGKQLMPTQCGVCDGKGYYRELLIFKTECEVCSGRGRVLRCPDEFSHILEDLKLPSRYNLGPVYKNYRKSTLPKPSSPKVPLTGPKPVKPQTQVPPPWHPSYPFPWHPAHPRNPRNQPFSPLNPNSPTNPSNPRHPSHPLNPNNPINRKPFKK
ncbi:MAG TPA: hypothetical protein VJL34_03370 [Anaerolineales bacterium]|nr:hypothetical protein [Anaerolineales bacterium]